MWYALGSIAVIVGLVIADEVRLFKRDFGRFPSVDWYRH